MSIGCDKVDNFFLKSGKIKKNVYLENENIGNLNMNIVEKNIEKKALNIDINPQNAVIDEANWEIRGESIGKKVNIKQTLRQLKMAKECEKVSILIDEVKPNITQTHLESKILQIWESSTPLYDKNEFRINNIEIACKTINYKIINPGQEFSFNETLGSRTADKGYKSAPIIIKKGNKHKKGYGLGGGVCQVSTTLYNAVKMAGLDILERNPHSKDIGYVESGNDAAVSFGSLDFRFRNNKNKKIMIRSQLSREFVVIKILERVEE